MSRYILAAAALAILLLGAHAVVATLAEGAYLSHGVRVTGFLGERLPAQMAGIVPGDIILMMDGAQIRSSKDYLAAFEGKLPGDVMEVATHRGVFRVGLASYFADAKKPLLGLAVEDVTVPLRPSAEGIAAAASGLSWASLIATAFLIALLAAQLQAVAGALALAGLNVLDVVSTFLFLAQGKTEANPLGFALMHHLGFFAAAAIKIGMMVLCAYLLARLASFKGLPGVAAKRTLHFLVIVYGVVVFRNLLALA